MHKEKFRHRYNDLFDLPSILVEKFPWIARVRPDIRTSTVPATIIYQITTVGQNFDSDDKHRQDFELFIFNLFEIEKYRASVIFCWETTGLTLFIFMKKVRNP